VDFILMLVKKLTESKDANANKEIKASIDRAVSSNLNLRSKRDLIEKFIESLNNESDIDSEWKTYIDEQKRIELLEIVESENLLEVETFSYIERAFRDGVLQFVGTALIKILPPRNMFSQGNEHGEQKQRVADRLQTYFDRFYEL